ncbi:L-lysine exporter family protein LysE/ArgO [Nocardioides luteus]|uniref:Amino acid transporter n=1 Tax=Nocardioides luteus TaxID=1844 RepID=A0ABQ5SX70_9ACTN|nr:LysE/ArgO family amino acid transporter [Nocardioides luteus]MDR7312522.1 L-lysine exporter family protein LysE/ArgO [Nocardioides luteus]GGR45735.1 amino acid transporter [Nocardioides luteus]GLJ68770.1 amino acid transporter [Nocardioides luteus]
MLTASLAGLLTGLTLIVAIGSQNAYVLRQGILRSHILVVVAVCAASDLILICAGVGGMGAVVERAGWVMEVLRWLGVAFLGWYGIGSFRRALRPSGLDAADAPADSLLRVAAKAAAFTWLNPHVYIDTLVLHGSIAATYGAARWGFAVGGCLASIIWFAGLGYGARLLAPLLASRRAWRVLDSLIGVTMLAIAGGLAVGGLG